MDTSRWRVKRKSVTSIQGSTLESKCECLVRKGGITQFRSETRLQPPRKTDFVGSSSNFLRLGHDWRC